MSYQPADTLLPWELAQWEAVSLARLSQMAEIRRRVAADDGTGGATETPTQVATVACALTRMDRPREILSGGQVAGIADWRMLLPLDTEILPADEILPWWLWTVTLGAPTAGTFTLSYNAQTTAALAYTATAAAVASALAGLSTIGSGNVAVSGMAGGPYHVRLMGDRRASALSLTGSGAGLTAGTFSVARPIFEVIGAESGATDQPLITAYLSRRRP